MAEWAFRRLSTLMRPRFCVSVDRRTCVDQSRHLAQEAVLRVHIVRLEERASEHHFQEIVTLFALNGGMLSSKLSMNVMSRRLGRRKLVWINVTATPTAEWIARQITEAFPWDGAPRYLIRDRDRIYGRVVTRRLRAMGIRDKPTAPASPWQRCRTVDRIDTA